VSDAITLRSLLPLDRAERFRLVAFGTAQRGSVITGGGLEPAIDLLAADVGFLFQPVGVPLMASFDYNLEDQTGHTVGTTIFPSLHRQMVMVTLTATWGTYTPWRAPSGAWMQPSRVRELTRALEGQETVFRLGIMQVAGKVSSIVDAFKKRNEKSA